MQIDHRYEFHTNTCESASQAHVVEASGILWLTNVYTHIDHRRKGLNRLLITRIIEELGHRDIYLKVQAYADTPMNPPALQAYYLTFGFVATDVPGVMVRRGEQ